MTKRTYLAKVLPRKKGRYEHDVLADGSDYLRKRLERLPEDDAMRPTWHPVGLSNVSGNPYEAVDHLGIDLRRVRSASAYRCPALDIRFQAMVPMCLMTKDLQGNYPEFQDHSLKMLSDANWMWQMGGEFRVPGSFQRALLGSGYTDGCLPSDGIHEISPALMRLSNGDALVVAVWDWFNR